MVYHVISPVGMECVQAGGHTILLLQPEKDTLSRTFYDFRSLEDALAGIAQIFENQLREVNKGRKDLTYDLSDLYRYIDRLPDMSLLVLDERSQQYSPHGKSGIKEYMLNYVMQRQS